MNRKRKTNINSYFITPKKRQDSGNNMDNLPDTSPAETDEQLAFINEMWKTKPERTQSIEESRSAKQRYFKNEWKHNRPWLQYDPVKKLMFCSYCQSANLDNSFTHGCAQLKKDAIVKHEKARSGRNSHVAANKILKSSDDMEKAIIQSKSKSKNSVISAMRNVYYLVKHKLANSLLDSLNKLCIMQGVTHLNNLVRDAHTSYTHNTSISEFQKNISSVIQEEILNDLDKSMCYGILIDESMDVSVHANLIVYVRYVKNGTPTSKFLTLVQLEYTTAEKITESLLQCFAQHNVEIEKISGITTDGAATMLGRKSGVTTRLKVLVPGLISVHCISHRLALASSHAADSVTYLIKFQEIVNNIYKYFQNSAKNMAKLEQIQKISETKRNVRFKRVCHTRWLSFEGAIHALVTNFDSLLSVLMEDKSARATGLLKSISNYKFAFVVHFFDDVLAQMAILCKSFQKETIVFGDVYPLLHSTKKNIEDLTKSFSGKSLTQFMSELHLQVNKASFKGHILKYSEKLKIESRSICKQFTKTLLKNLEDRFEENDDAVFLSSTCKIFTPTSALSKDSDYLLDLTNLVWSRLIQWNFFNKELEYDQSQLFQ